MDKTFPMHVALPGTTNPCLSKGEKIVQVIFACLMSAMGGILLLATLLSKEFTFLLPAAMFIVFALIIATRSWFPRVFRALNLYDSVMTGTAVRSTTVDYKDVKILYIGELPACFTPIRGKGGPTPKHRAVWAEHYGKNYMVGTAGAEGEELFACTYNPECWEILKQKCTNAAVYEAEPEYTTYLQMRKKIEKETEERNGYEKIVDSFDGYVN